MTDIAAYEAHGWKLCAIEAGKKAPVYSGWQVNPMPAEGIEALGSGVGLLHAFSGTCALDLDNLEIARLWLAERGVDVDALLEAEDAVRIDSGRPGRAKLLYRMKRPLRTFKPKGSGLELRCATADPTKSVQDVLPPTIHPDTKKPYEWLYGDLIAGHWSKLPPVPAGLLACWRELVAGPGGDSVEPVSEGPVVDLEKARKAAFRHSPDCEYDEWIKVGMQLHQGTRGAQEGLDIWRAWSAGITRKPYPGDGVLKTHWLSFGSGPGKHLATGAALIAELPAEADEFPIVGTEPDAESTEALLKAQVQEKRKASIAALEKRLVYVINSERYFDTEKHKIIGSDNALEHMFTCMMPRGKGGVPLNPAKVLKASGTKTLVDSIGFHPGAGTVFESGGDSFANTYRNRLPAPLEPTAGELERITWLFDRVDDPTYRAWLLRFFAHVVQRPGAKINSAPLIWSAKQGNGKTTLLKMIPQLLVGPTYSKEVTSGLLHSDFTDYLLNAWHVNLTEFRAGTRGEREAIAEKLKPWIADSTISIHPKGMPGFTMPNVFFVTATSNKDDAAAIDNNDRRWAIHEMHAPQFTEAEQSWVYNEFLLLPRAPAVLRHYFLNVPLDGFVASAKAPETTARAEMVESSISPDIELLQTAWEQHAAPLARDVVLTNEVADHVRKHSKTNPTNLRIGKLLCQPPFNGKAHQFRSGHGVYRCVVLRNHGRWLSASGADLMAHILNEDIDITA